MYKISIIDDDKEAMSNLENMLKVYGYEHNIEFNISQFSDPEFYLKEQDVESHIIFLDIKMPQIDGLSLAKKIRLRRPNVIIIFCTSFQRFAINGYEVNAFGFLVKPIQEYSFKYYLAKAIKRIQEADEEKMIKIKTLDSYQMLKVSDIYYVEVSKHYLFYHIKKWDSKDEEVEEVLQARGSMKELEISLEGCGFARCNVSYLINLNYVTSLKGNKVYLSNEVIEISRGFKKEFTTQFMKFFSKKGSAQ